jgi:hypothetical protein
LAHLYRGDSGGLREHDHVSHDASWCQGVRERRAVRRLPCTYHTRYGFPNRIRVQIEQPSYERAEFFLDTEPPLASYLLLGFGSYLFHTFNEEYRFTLKKVAGAPPAPPAGGAVTPPAP